MVVSWSRVASEVVGVVLWSTSAVEVSTFAWGAGVPLASSLAVLVVLPYPYLGPYGVVFMYRSLKFGGELNQLFACIFPQE